MQVRQRRHTLDHARGAALLIVLMTIMLLSVFGSVLLMVSGTESRIASNARTASQAFYAADAALDRALVDLARAPDWTAVLAGTFTSTFVDGPPGTRQLADGRELELTTIADLASCDRPSCSLADFMSVTANHPWGPNNPRWRLFGHGPLAETAGVSPTDSPFYVVVLVADDTSEADGDPWRDAEAGRPGAGLISVRAEAYGPFQAFGAVQVTVGVATAGTPVSDANLHIVSWRLDR